ncbi:MAG: hypothetical protein MRZ79_07680 [Bacteroidia bacterium]|nr:hypothetical protein [Bacteroidia bacterium]
MKKLLIILFCCSLVFTACSEKIPKSCNDIEAEDVIGWIKKDYKKVDPDNIWIGIAIYEGETIYYTSIPAEEGFWFCGTGLEFYDMYNAYDCKGKKVEGIMWNDLSDQSEFYSSFKETVVEQDPS